MQIYMYLRGAYFIKLVDAYLGRYLCEGEL
jgi:hypothetical protein